MKCLALALLMPLAALGQSTSDYNRIRICDPSSGKCAAVNSSGQVGITGSISTTGAGDTVGTAGTLGSLNAAVSVALAGQGGAGLHLSAGTLVGTIVPELSVDNGTTWVATNFITAAGSTQSSVVFGSANTATEIGIVLMGGAREARVRVSAYTSGTASGFLVATYAQTAAAASGGGGGTVTQGSPPWTQRIQDGSGSNLAAVTAGNALKVDGSAVTQPVSGTVTANIGTSGSLALDASVGKLTLAQGSTTSGQTGPLLQGAVTSSSPSYTTAQTSPLSLTTSGALRTDASATTQPVSGTVSTVLPTNSATGTLGSLNATLNINLTGQQGAAFNLTSSTLIGTLTAQCVAGAQVVTTRFYDPNAQTFSATQVVASGSSYSLVVVPCGGYPTVQVQVTAYTSGSGTGTIYTSTAAAPTAISNAVSNGQATMANSMPVVIASNQSAVPASEIGTWNVGLSTGTNTVGAVNQGTTNGTNAAAWWMQIGDTTNGPVAVKAASTAAAATDKSLVVGLSPNSPIPAGSSSIGTVGLNSGSNTIGSVKVTDGTTTPTICTNTLAISQTALNGAAQIIAGVSAKKIYICGVALVATSAVSTGFVEGTGSNCATGQTNTTGQMAFGANGGLTLGLSQWALPFTTTAADALCVKTSGASDVNGWISYAQF